MPQNFNLIWFILWLPLLGFLIQAFFGAAIVRKLGAATGKRVMGTLAVLPIAIVAIVSASLYAATHSADRHGGTTFASRFENVYTR